jgi:hypothetical protein
MSTEPATSDINNEDKPGDEDVEGHFLTLSQPVAWELAKARQQEIARETTRHTLYTEAKAKARRKG